MNGRGRPPPAVAKPVMVHHSAFIVHTCSPGGYSNFKEPGASVPSIYRGGVAHLAQLNHILLRRACELPRKTMEKFLQKGDFSVLGHCAFGSPKAQSCGGWIGDKFRVVQLIRSGGLLPGNFPGFLSLFA